MPPWPAPHFPGGPWPRSSDFFGGSKHRALHQWVRDGSHKANCLVGAIGNNLHLSESHASAKKEPAVLNLLTWLFD